MTISASTSSISRPLAYAGRVAVRDGKEDGAGKPGEKPSEASSRQTGLSEQERKQIAELRSIDQQVRAHEAAHLAASGGYARGGANFSLVKGPDGVLYATGGEVQIDVSPVSGDPEATLRKAETIRRAALAPANPSSQDRQVAAAASRMALTAEMERAQQTRLQTQTSRYAETATDRRTVATTIDQTA